MTPADSRAARPRFAWSILLIAALAMVGTLPGRTQGLGLITEPLLKDLSLDAVEYARLNLWATLIGSLACVGVGQLQDRIGSRIVLAALALALGASVLGMSRTDASGLLLFLILVRALGQSALSVASLTLMGQWFRERADRAMALYSVILSVGFMIAFPLVGAVVAKSGWRVAWAGIGAALLVTLAPLAALLVRRPPERVSAPDEPFPTPSWTFGEALRTPAFWVMALSSAVYGLAASGIGLFNEAIFKARGFPAGIYYNSLAVTALTGLIGNFLGGWLTLRGGMTRLMAAAMALLMVGLAALPLLAALWQVMAVAAVMGLAGGFVTVLFFAFWSRVYGKAHLGKIQGAAQAMTVLASAVGPLLLELCVKRTGSDAAAFYILAGVVGLLAVASWLVRVPTRPA